MKSHKFIFCTYAILFVKSLFTSTRHDETSTSTTSARTTTTSKTATRRPTWARSICDKSVRNLSFGHLRNNWTTIAERHIAERERDDDDAIEIKAFPRYVQSLCLGKAWKHKRGRCVHDDTKASFSHPFYRFVFHSQSLFLALNSLSQSM